MFLDLIKRGGVAAGVAAGVTMLGFVINGASAQTDPVLDAFTDMQSKVTLYGAAIVTLVVASLIIFLGIKYARKGASKA